MSDSLIASDLSYFVLQKRRQSGESGPCALDSSNQRLYPLPSALVQREAFMASRETIHDEPAWLALQAERKVAVGVGHFPWRPVCNSTSRRWQSEHRTAAQRRRMGPPPPVSALELKDARESGDSRRAWEVVDWLIAMLEQR